MAFGATDVEVTSRRDVNNSWGLSASSTQTLSATQTLTGQGTTNNFTDMLLQAYVEGGDATLYVDFSVDGGTNYDSTLSFTLSAGIPDFHTIVKGPRTTRVRVTAGASNLTAVRILTAHGVFRQGNAPLNLSISPDTDASVVRSVSTELDLALGRFGGMTEDAKFGYVNATDAADNAVDIWALATDTLANRLDTKTFPTSAFTLYAVSDSASDTDVDLTVPYLDANGELQTGSVNLDGQTPVIVSAASDCLDCNRALTSDTNSNEAVGNIYLMQGNTVTAGVPDTMADVVAYIPAGLGQSHQALDRVPTGYKMRMKRGVVTIARSSGAAGSATISLWTKPPSGTWIAKRRWELSNGNFIKPLAGLVLPEGTAVAMRAEDVSDNDTNITGEWHYDLVEV